MWFGAEAPISFNNNIYKYILLNRIININIYIIKM